MAIGTITITARVEDTNGTLKLFKCSFDGDDDYPTGGTADVQASLRTAIETAASGATDANVRGIENVTVVDVIPGDCGQYVPSWDYANGKLKVRDGGHATWDEVANTTDLSGTTFNVTFITK
jgi:hypothetical protein